MQNFSFLPALYGWIRMCLPGTTLPLWLQIGCVEMQTPPNGLRHIGAWFIAVMQLGREMFQISVWHTSSALTYQSKSFAQPWSYRSGFFAHWCKVHYPLSGQKIGRIANDLIQNLRVEPKEAGKAHGQILWQSALVLREEGRYSHIGIQRLSSKLLSSGCRLMLVAGKAGQSILSVDKLVHVLEGWRSEPGLKPPFLGSSKVAEELIQRWTNANAANADSQVSQAAIDGDVVRSTLLFCFHTHHSLRCNAMMPSQETAWRSLVTGARALRYVCAR
jgi:hypothetical protein